MPIPSSKSEDARYSRMYHIKSRGLLVSVYRIIEKISMHTAGLICRQF